MFENLLYIFSKDNGVINNYIKETESIREIKKLKLELHKRDTKLKILQRRYDKLLNNCIEIELNKKLNSKSLWKKLFPLFHAKFQHKQECRAEKEPLVALFCLLQDTKSCFCQFYN